MKRTLFTTMLLLAAMVTWAQRWTAPTGNDYPGETPIYLRIALNGERITGNSNVDMEVAAFVGDECRAVTNSLETVSATNGSFEGYNLRVWGDPAKDNGQTITIKAFYQGVVYKFNQTFTWNGETVQPIPVDLNLETVSNLEVADEGLETIEVPLPGTKDMSSLVQIFFNGKSADKVTGSQVDTDETELFLKWDAGNSAAFFTVDDNGLLTAVAETGENDGYLGVSIYVNDKKAVNADGTIGKESLYRYVDPFGFSISIKKPTVPVTNITCDIQELTVFLYDDVRNALSQHISVSPEDATDATWYITDTKNLVRQDIADEPGETTLLIYPNTPESDQVQPATVALTVKVRPTGISANPTTIDVELGDNVLDAIKRVITLTPQSDYIDDELTITPADATLYNAQTGIATKVGTTTVTVTPTNAESSNLPAAPSVTITLNVKKSVTAIALEAGEITVYVGDNVKDAISGRVTITPTDATEKAFEIVEVGETLRISDDLAAMSGVTAVKVQSVDNPQLVSDNSVTVNIMERPTGISVSPAEITVNIGDNVYEAIEQIVTLEPNLTYLDRSLTLTPGNNVLYDNSYIANKVGTMTVTVTPTAAVPDVTGAPVPYANVTVTVVQPVAGITLKGDAITVYVGDDVAAALQPQVTILPEDATDKTFEVVETRTENLLLKGGEASLPGITTVKVTANGLESEKTAEVTVKVRPDAISGPDELTVNVGDNVFDAIKNVLVFDSKRYPDSEFIDDEMELSTTAESALYDSKYVATTVGTMSVVVTAVATKNSDAAGPLTKTIRLTVKKGVTSLTATETTVTAMVGDDVFTMIDELITVNPEDATNKAYSLKPDNASQDAFSQGIATAEGTWKLIATSEDNPGASLEFTVVVKTPIALTYESQLETTVGGEVTLTLTKVAGTDGVDASKVEVLIDDTDLGKPATATPDATGLVWTFKGLLSGMYTFVVLYDGVPQMNSSQEEAGWLSISQVVAPSEGWDWITINSLASRKTSILLRNANGWNPILTGSNGKIIEIRSQKALLYNDPTLGLFGDITELKPGDGMYKIKSEGSVVFNLGEDVTQISADALPQTAKGYVWLGYPHLVDQPLSALADALATTAEEGDMIIGKDNFAEFSNGEWVAADGFTFKAGKGYMYYTAGAGGKTVDWGTPVAVDDTNNPNPAKSLHSNAWNYDASQFADNMPIVATVQGVDFLDNYSIGAFVGDECRGEGRVAAGKYMFINVAGKGGETVSFKLYNKVTGEYTNLGTTVSYGQKVGSVSKPLTLLAGTTGISSVGADSEGAAISYSNGAVCVNGMPGALVTITNAAGSVVRTSSEAVVSLDGLANGVYIVTVSSGAQRISKKILK